MKQADEFREKMDRVRGLLQREALAGILLKRQSNFSWITCGGQCSIVMASDTAHASVLITPSRAVLIAANNEIERLVAEEIKGLTEDLGTEQYAWNQKSDFEVANALMQGKKWGCDVPCRSARLVNNTITAIRTPLHVNEVARYRQLGKDVGGILGAVARKLKPGMTEQDAAGMIGGQCMAQGIIPAVVLVAADDRIKKFRHPTPTDMKIKKRVMLIANVKRHGLHASATRTVSFETPPSAIVERHAACCRIEAMAMAAARPEVPLGKVLQTMIAQYEAEGFPDEWRLHHQGGPIGYDGRDMILTVTGLKAPVLEGQAFALNPTIAGAKSEDTFIVQAKSPDIITLTKDWPVVECKTPAGVIPRPGILVV
ncbi:MAG: M24 family metallopeptidase [Candidatus Sumerlaeota bacterium]|nr:M24 family metallopeptidase [Candidatus Sumerlaeota bacterium]